VDRLEGSADSCLKVVNAAIGTSTRVLAPPGWKLDRVPSRTRLRTVSMDRPVRSATSRRDRKSRVGLSFSLACSITKQSPDHVKAGSLDRFEDWKLAGNWCCGIRVKTPRKRTQEKRVGNRGETEIASNQQVRSHLIREIYTCIHLTAEVLGRSTPMLGAICI
jgi:hypothetical protein